MADERLDLSLLDPKRDRARWVTLAQSVTRRARRFERPRQELLYLVFTWGRPALAVGAVVALFCWAGASGSQPSSDAFESPLHPRQHLSRWAISGARPATSEILLVLGNEHERP